MNPAGVRGRRLALAVGPRIKGRAAAGLPPRRLEKTAGWQQRVILSKNKSEGEYPVTSGHYRVSIALCPLKIFRQLQVIFLGPRYHRGILHSVLATAL